MARQAPGEGELGLGSLRSTSGSREVLAKAGRLTVSGLDSPLHPSFLGTALAGSDSLQKR